MALPTYFGSGTFTAGAAGITPPFPPSTVAGDVALLVVESENQAITLTTANGFVEVGSQATKSAGTAAVDPANRIAVYWKRLVGGDSAPVVADSGNHQTGQIHVFRGVKATGNPWNVFAEGNDGAANDTSGSIPGATTAIPNCLVVLICGTSFNGTSTAQFSGYTNADLANILERTDNSDTIQLGGGHGMATGEKATAGAYGATTVTLANTSFKGTMSLALAQDESAVGASAGVGTASVLGASVFAGVTASPGVGTAAVVGAAVWGGVGASAGVATASADGEDAAGGTIVAADGSSAGVASSSVVGAAVFATAAASAGIATPAAVGAAVFAGRAETAGLAVAVSISAALSLGVGASEGSAAASGISGAIAGSVASSAGSATVSADGENAAAAPPPPPTPSPGASVRTPSVPIHRLRVRLHAKAAEVQVEAPPASCLIGAPAPVRLRARAAAYGVTAAGARATLTQRPLPLTLAAGVSVVQLGAAPARGVITEAADEVIALTLLGLL